MLEDTNATNGRESTQERLEADTSGQAQSSASDRPESEAETSVKQEQVGTYMYLPEYQTKELRRVYNILKAKYEFEFDEEFEKNRHFYPLVVMFGLKRLTGLDAYELQSSLDEIE